MQVWEITELIATAVVVGLLFFMERLRPLRRTSYMKYIRLDILALIVSTIGLNSIRIFSQAQEAFFSQILTFQVVGSMPIWLRVLLSMLLIDLVQYVFHRSMHRIAFLWKAHKWHHSVKELYWFSGNRASLIQLIFYLGPQILIPLYVMQLPPWALGIPLIMGVVAQFFTHSNVRVKWKWVQYIFVTPNTHFTHHSSDIKYQNRNFGSFFTIWDHLFGTFQHPEDVDLKELGLGDEAQFKARYLLGV